MPGWPLAVPLAVTLAVGLWGLTARPYWGDEMDTVSAVSRSLPQLARLLGHVDAIHGFYYLVLWPVVHIAGTSPLMTRLPSAVAMAGAAAGVTAIGRRLRSLPAGMYAGLVFAIFPVVTGQAHDARPYAMVTAAAVLASYLLVRAAADPRAAWFAGYALALALLGYLELFALLLVPAHAITLFARRRRPGETRSLVGRRWLAAVTAAGGALAPVLIWGWWQHSEFGWIHRPGWPDIRYLVIWLAMGSLASAVLIAALAVYGSRGTDGPGRPLTRLALPQRALPWLALPRLALPWLVLPPVTLIAASQIHPVYSFRYVGFCLPAVALLAGAGLAAMRWALAVAALAVLAVLALPAQRIQRVPGSGGGGGMAAASQVLARYGRPGDAIVYPGPGIAPWYLAYPAAFEPLRDISLSQRAATIGRLYDSIVPIPVLIRRERGAGRIWVIQYSPPWQDLAPYLAPGFRLARAWQLHHDQARLALYQLR